MCDFFGMFKIAGELNSGEVLLDPLERSFNDGMWVWSGRVLC